MACSYLYTESLHNSWKLKTSQFLHGQHTHRTCHPLSMFGMLWIGSKRQRVPVPANIPQLCTAIEQEWTNIPQATINNLINSMRRRCVALLEANGGHSRYSGRGKEIYAGGAVWGGGGCSQFLRINITPNRNRKSCYSLRTFMRSC